MPTGYGVCVHIIHDYRAIFCADSRGTDRDKSVRRLRGDCTAIVQFQCSHRTVSASFQWNRTEPVRLPCRGCTEICINSCIRVSKCPRVTRLSSHAWLHPDRSLSAPLSCLLLFQDDHACSLLLICLDCNLRYAVLRLKGGIVLLKS